MPEMSDLRRRTRRRRQQNGREQAEREPTGRGQNGRQQSGRVQNGRQDRGAVTAETAIVLPVLVVLLLVGLWAVGVVVANIRCVDAARDVARAVARGEPGDVAKRIGERSAPAGAVVGISRDGADVRVVVDADVKLDWVPLSKLPSVEVRGQAAVQIEPGSWEDLP
jgi:Flp pilus assembly protein TadG